MLLEIHERIALLELIPTQADYAGLKAIRVAREQISLTPEEMRFIALKEQVTPDGKKQLYWNIKKAMDAARDIPITDYIEGIIQTSLAKMEKAKKLEERYFSVYEKFMGINR